MSVLARARSTAPRLYTVVAMALLGFVGLAIGFLVAGLIAGVLIGSGIDLEERPFLSIVISLVSIQGVGLSVVGLVYLTSTGRGVSYLRARMPSLRDLGWVGVGTLAIFALLFLVGIVISAINQATGVEPAQNNIVDVASRNPTILLLMIPAAFLVIGPAEELLFRGIIQRRLREVFGSVAAIGIASVIFGLGHAAALTGGSGGVGAIAIPLAALSLLSVVFGVAYERTDNLMVPILIHGAYDAILFGLIYVLLTAGGDLGAAANDSAVLLAALL